jgi:formate hydrogenlyase transcriptional activator
MAEDRDNPCVTRSWEYADVSAASLSSGLENELLGALRKLTSTLDVEGVCDAVLGGVEHVFGATSSWIMLHDPAANVLRTVVFRGRGADVYGGVEIPADRGIAGMVFTRGEIRFVADATLEGRWFDPDRVQTSGLQSVFILPLIAEDRPVGVLGIDSPLFGAERPPTPRDVKRLEVFAAQAAVGLINARRHQASVQDRARLRALLRERRALRLQVIGLRDEVRNAYSFGAIVGGSAAVRTVLAELEQVAASDVTVLLLGETGTGKELLARAVHERSARGRRPFVPVNCAALPEPLVESEMFGHERGAFTGALARKPGRFELADRGTLFLDEIGDLPVNAQGKLLRVLQDGEVYRVGGTQPVKIDVRLVAATNQDLPARVAERAFREDLYYRLSVFPIRVPPLRDRTEDIPLLAQHFALQFARRLNKRITAIAGDAVDLLTSYAWPGNVRELQNVIERAVILTMGPELSVDSIRLDRVPGPAPAPGSPALSPAPERPPGPSASPSLPRSLADAERDAIIAALRESEGRVSGPAGAARLLGVKPTTLHAKMKRLGVRRRDALSP